MKASAIPCSVLCLNRTQKPVKHNTDMNLNVTCLTIYSQFYGSVNCMKEVYKAHPDQFSCDPGMEQLALMEMLHTFLKLDAYAHHNCSWNATKSYGDRFKNCTGR